VAEPAIPTYVDLLLPTLKALDGLGGSGTKDEVDEETVDLLHLTSEQMAVEFPPEARQKGSKVVHRLAWARTYLKKFGAVDNTRRGVWTLEAPGRKYLEMDSAEATKALREADAEVRRQRRLDQLAAATSSDSEDDEDVSDDASAEDALASSTDWKKRLLERLLAMSPDAFERLAQRLLREAGFKNVEVTVRSGDGGIDGIGVYRPSLVSFPIFFQCKRYKDTVGPSVVRDFRGAMAGRGEKGLLITTGTFTAEAKRESTRDGAPPVELIDGSDLCDLLKEYGVGVHTRSVEIVDLQESFFDAL
jgi:restriction system protein